jgi:NAD(P)-dependent dehydrogenase (short-subunit alcohol dehydrogenase family)
MNLFDLTGKKCLITGETGLLAPIWKETLESAGATVFCIEPPLYDVRDSIQMKQLADRFEKDGKIDIVINNAAIDNPPTSKATFFGNCKEILDVNLQGAVNVCETFIPQMVKNGGGVIVNIGSIQSFVGADWRNYPDPDFAKPVGYNLSKTAYIGLARSLTTQYGRYNIRSVTIAFSAYDGGKLEQEFLKRFLKCVPLGRNISKQSLQTTLLFACCCPEFAGQTVLVDAGYTSW